MGHCMQLANSFLQFAKRPLWAAANGVGGTSFLEFISYTVKKVTDFPIPSLAVNNLVILVQGEFG
jgi:hypothetical protein